MDVNSWMILIGVVGTLVLQILGRIQAWHLAVIAARTEVKTELNRSELGTKVDQVQQKVDGSLSKLVAEVAALAEANASLREQVSSLIERDLTTAGIAKAKGAV